MYAVIRLRGTVKAKKEVIDTLKMLRLNRKMHCVLIKETPDLKGMVRRVKDYVTWGEINDDILKLLIQKRGRKIGNRRVSKEEVNKIFNEIKNNNIKNSGIKPVFRLTPPSKGFKKSIKQHYPKGELGYRRKEINELLKRMI